MSDTTKIRDAIRDTLQRNLKILAAQSQLAHRLTTDDQTSIVDVLLVTDVAAMLDACEANLTMVIEELQTATPAGEHTTRETE